MKKIFFFFLFSVSSTYSQDAEQLYIIKESEIQSIENLSKRYETEKLNWLSQVKDLNSQVKELKTQSTNLSSQVKDLNSQLQNQLKLNGELQTCYNRLEKEKSQRESEMTSEIFSLSRKLNENKIGLTVAIGVAVVESLVLFFMFYMKFRCSASTP